MTSWKYTPGRLILSAFLVLVIFRAVKLLLDVHVETRDLDTNAVTTISTPKDAAKRICERSEDGLSSLVWSHRAHFSDEEVDGSQQSVEQLLKFGIRNFDVDVSCNVLPSSNVCEYVVAHPSVFVDKEKLEHRKHIQSVTSFLNQIHAYIQANTDVKSASAANSLTPVITLEMKFTKASHQVDFVKLVQASPLAGNVAIIGSDPSISKNILPYLTHSGLAAAYRTKPLSNHDYTWPEPTLTEHHTMSSGGLFFNEQTERQSFTPVPPPLVIASPSASNQKGASTTVGSNVTAHSLSVASEEDVSLLPNSQTLRINTPQAASRKYLQIYMPDVKLLKYPLLWQKVFESEKSADQTSSKVKSLRLESTGDNNNSKNDSGPDNPVSTATGATTPHDPHRFVVAWVVDTNAELFDAIAKGVDGVISNRPVALLAELRSLYAQHCRAGGGKIK